MGADGGMCWMKLSNPSKYDRVVELLTPFYFLTYVDDYHQSNHDWMDAEPIIMAPEYILGSYGSFQTFDIYDTLRHILNPEEFNEGAREVCSDPSLTFAELLQDLATRPMLKSNSGGAWVYLPEERSIEPISGYYRYYDVNSKQMTLLEIMLWDLMHYHWNDEAKIASWLKPIADIKVADWLEELNSLLEHNNCGQDETWT